MVTDAGLTRSRSKKGCNPDNSVSEGFFKRLKKKMFYNKSWIGVTMDEFINTLDKYIHWYAEKRRKITLGGLIPTLYPPLSITGVILIRANLFS